MRSTWKYYQWVAGSFSLRVDENICHLELLCSFYWFSIVVLVTLCSDSTLLSTEFTFLLQLLTVPQYFLQGVLLTTALESYLK